MTIPNTDLTALFKLLENAPAEAALPCNLSDEVLLQIARDLRLVEISCTIDENVDPPFAGATYLVFHMMVAQAEKLSGKPECNAPLDRLEHWMQRYMHYVEREIVSRAVKMPCQVDTDELMAEIQREVLEAN